MSTRTGWLVSLVVALTTSGLSYSQTFEMPPPPPEIALRWKVQHNEKLPRDLAADGIVVKDVIEGGVRQRQFTGAPNGKGRIPFVGDKVFVEGLGSRDVRIEVDPGVGETTYAGLVFKQSCVLEILLDGTLITNKEGVRAKGQDGMLESMKAWHAPRPSVAPRTKRAVGGSKDDRDEESPQEHEFRAVFAFFPDKAAVRDELVRYTEARAQVSLSRAKRALESSVQILDVWRSNDSKWKERQTNIGQKEVHARSAIWSEMPVTKRRLEACIKEYGGTQAAGSAKELLKDESYWAKLVQMVGDQESNASEHLALAKQYVEKANDSRAGLELIYARSYEQSKAAVEARKLLAELEKKGEREGTAAARKQLDNLAAEEREKAAAGKLRHAKVFLEDGKRGDAKEFCEEIIRSYPSTRAAAEAKLILDKLKKPK